MNSLSSEYFTQQYLNAVSGIDNKDYETALKILVMLYQHTEMMSSALPKLDSTQKIIILYQFSRLFLHQENIRQQQIY